MALATEVMASTDHSSGPAVRPDLLSIKEVAVILDVHVVTVRRLIEARKLPAVRVGRLVKVRRSAVLEYYRAHMR